MLTINSLPPEILIWILQFTINASPDSYKSMSLVSKRWKSTLEKYDLKRIAEIARSLRSLEKVCDEKEYIVFISNIKRPFSHNEEKIYEELYKKFEESWESFNQLIEDVSLSDKKTILKNIIENKIDSIDSKYANKNLKKATAIIQEQYLTIRHYYLLPWVQNFLPKLLIHKAMEKLAEILEIELGQVNKQLYFNRYSKENSAKVTGSNEITVVNEKPIEDVRINVNPNAFDQMVKDFQEEQKCWCCDPGFKLAMSLVSEVVLGLATGYMFYPGNILLPLTVPNKYFDVAKVALIALNIIFLLLTIKLIYDCCVSKRNYNRLFNNRYAYFTPDSESKLLVEVAAKKDYGTNLQEEQSLIDKEDESMDIGSRAFSL